MNIEIFPLDEYPCSLEVIIAQLQHHRETHIQWANWLEKNPGSPHAVEEVGNLEFHQKVEGHYATMINFLQEILANENCMDD